LIEDDYWGELEQVYQLTIFLIKIDCSGGKRRDTPKGNAIDRV